MFTKIDAKTRRCEYDWGTSIRVWAPHGLAGKYTYTGTLVNGVPNGIGRYENKNYIIYATIEDNEVEGF